MVHVVVERVSCHFLRVKDEDERPNLGEGEEGSDGEGRRSRLLFEVEGSTSARACLVYQLKRRDD